MTQSRFGTSSLVSCATTPAPVPMKLTDSHLMILSAASQREDRGIEFAANLKGGAAQKLVRKLLTDGLIEEVRAAIWRREEDNRPLALLITKTGLAATRWMRRDHTLPVRVLAKAAIAMTRIA
jgi:hypothetical protein